MSQSGFICSSKYNHRVLCQQAGVWTERQGTNGTAAAVRSAALRFPAAVLWPIVWISREWGHMLMVPRKIIQPDKHTLDFGTTCHSVKAMRTSLE